jgi:hypothetical protein
MKKKILLNSINTNSAGTSNITKLVINEVKDIHHYKIILDDNEFFKDEINKNSNHIIVKRLGSGLKRIINRLSFELLGLKKDIDNNDVDTVLIMANYSILPLNAKKKIVIMRHPYLVDIDAWKEIKTKKHHFIEIIRKFLFTLTLKSTDKLIVQTVAMKEMFLKEYPNFNNELTVVNNPVSNDILSQRSNGIVPCQDRGKYLFYPSRYYAHKNHEIIVNILLEKKSFFRENGYKFVVTLSDTGEGRKILVKHGLQDFFINIGEVAQEELHYYYKNALMLFFPSQAETFGNSIVEAMCFGLPIFINNKPYAKTLCGEAAYYCDLASTVNVIDDLKEFISKIDEYSDKSKRKSSGLLNSDDWINKIIN